MLFTVTFTSFPWDFYFVKLTQPLTVSTVQLLCTVKEKGGKSEKNPYSLSSLWFKKSIQKPQVWELLRLCTETSTKLYVHEFGFSTHKLRLIDRTESTWGGGLRVRWPCQLVNSPSPSHFPPPWFPSPNSLPGFRKGIILNRVPEFLSLQASVSPPHHLGPGGDTLASGGGERPRRTQFRRLDRNSGTLESWLYFPFTLGSLHKIDKQVEW